MMMRVDPAPAVDATMAYVVNGSPCTLPSVTSRDFVAAWDMATDAPSSGAAATACRAFRFIVGDGRIKDLLLHDRDANCWMDAIDRRFRLGSCYGLSVCLRVLALVDLMSGASWAVRFPRAGTGSMALSVPLLRVAAELRLTEEALFDESAFLTRLQKLPRSLMEPPGASTCCHSRLVSPADPLPLRA